MTHIFCHLSKPLEEGEGENGSYYLFASQLPFRFGDATAIAPLTPLSGQIVIQVNKEMIGSLRKMQINATTQLLYIPLLSKKNMDQDNELDWIRVYFQTST